MNGIRVFKDEDFAWLKVVNCLKNTGMPIKEIQKYLDLCRKGDDTLDARLEMMLDQKRAVEEHMKLLEENLKELDYKIWYYQTAVDAGTESIHEGHACNPSFEPDEIPHDGNIIRFQK